MHLPTTALKLRGTPACSEYTLSVKPALLPPDLDHPDLDPPDLDPPDLDPADLDPPDLDPPDLDPPAREPVPPARAPRVPRAGRSPVTISHSTIPSAYTSVASVISLPSNCSGAMYSGVPTSAPAFVSAVRAVTVSPVFREIARAIPKSISTAHGLPLRSASMMFRPFRSRWITPAS
jgi:hypothetical protein